MVATHTEPELELKAALDRFETRLNTPMMAGELIGWAEALEHEWSEFAAHVRHHAVDLHPQLDQQISAEDPGLLPRTEKLRTEDAEIVEDCEVFDRLLHNFVDQAPKFEPDEEKIASYAGSLVDKGVALANRVRKQETAMQTWFVEAFTRDRGVVD